MQKVPSIIYLTQNTFVDTIVILIRRALQIWKTFYTFSTIFIMFKFSKHRTYLNNS